MHIDEHQVNEALTQKFALGSQIFGEKNRKQNFIGNFCHSFENVGKSFAIRIWINPYCFISNFTTHMSIVYHQKWFV